MCEVLIQARGHWQDGWNQAKVDALSDGDKKSHNARIQLGDIVVVKPDGWVWGREETLPRYIVIKAPGVAVEDVAHLTEHLMDTTDSDPDKHFIKKKRKYQIPNGWLNTHLDEDVVTLTPAEIILVMDNIVEKS